MMKVLVVNNAVPFVWGGAEELAANLCRRLNSLKGVQSELLRIPFSWEPKSRIVLEIILNQNLRVINADRVVALKFPAYLIQHERKTIWLLHQFRQAYDLLDAGKSYLARGTDDSVVDAVTKADNECFDSACGLYANSPVTQKRLWHYNQRRCGVLYPPLNDAELFDPGPYGRYLFAGGRVSKGKRQRLLLEAARVAGEGCSLIIAGPPDDAAYADELHHFVAKHDLQDRVALRLHMHTREQIADLARNALACVYIPFDEDSLGYVTMEAVACARAVVTTSDSGGLLELIKDGETGLVCQPDATSLAQAFRRLYAEEAFARELGMAAREFWRSKNINWQETLDQLLA